MYEPVRPKVESVIGPYGPVTAADLPPPKANRWSVRRKAIVVTAIRGGLLSLEDACSRYALDIEEFMLWQYCFDRYGLEGLRTTTKPAATEAVSRFPPHVKQAIAEKRDATTYTKLRLRTANSQTLGVMTLLFGELIRACQEDIVRLAGVDHGLSLRRRLIRIIQESQTLAVLPTDQVDEVRSVVMSVVENIVRFERSART